MRGGECCCRLPMYPPACWLIVAVGGASAGTSTSSPLVFQLRMEAPGGGGQKGAVALLTLRSRTAEAKQVWCDALREAAGAAAAGGGSGGPKGGSPATPLLPPQPPPGLLLLYRASSSSSASHGHGPEREAATAARKISTAVFPETAEAAGNPPGGLPAAADAATVDPELLEQRAAAAEAALVAAIEIQAALRRPTPHEAAVQRRVTLEVRRYVRSTAARLAGLTQRVVASGMLHRPGDMRQGLLAVLLPPGANPPRLDFAE